MNIIINLEHTWHKFIPEQSKMINSQCWYSSLHVSKPVQNHLESWQTLFSKLADTYTSSLVNITDVHTCVSKSDTCSRYFCLPRVIFGGFPKSGTTTLYNLITSHPNMIKPLQKERQFWREYIQEPVYDGFDSVSVLVYLYSFKKAAYVMEKTSGNLLTIDSSASTVFASSKRWVDLEKDICIAPVLISRLLPATKFIFIVRNPAERLWSDFWYTCSKTRVLDKSGTVTHEFKKMYSNAPELFHNYTVREIEKFNNCLLTSRSHFECVVNANSDVGILSACNKVRLGLSLYYYHLVKWYSLFSPNQILVLKFEDLVRDVSSTMNKVWTFLNLEELQSGQVERLLQSVEQNSIKSWIKNTPLDNFKMFSQTKELLDRFFYPYNLKLSSLLNDTNILW